MVINDWKEANFKGLAPGKEWSSLNDIEKQSIKNTIRNRLSLTNKDKFTNLCIECETILELSRNIALYIGLETKTNKERLFSLIMNGFINDILDSKVENQIKAVTENLHPITKTKISGRPKGQRASASLSWDFTSESIFSWIDNKTFESITSTDINVKLEHLRKDEVGLLVLRNLFNSESILKYMHTIKKQTINEKAKVVEAIGYSNIKMQLASIDIINPAVVKISNKVKEFMGNIDLFNTGAPTYFSVISSSLSAYYSEAELQGQSAAYLVFCEYISNQIFQLCCMKIESNGQTWDWTKESLKAWSERNPIDNTVTLQTATKETNKKLHLIFNLIAFNRVDLSIWGVPPTGKKQAVFWGDAL